MCFLFILCLKSPVGSFPARNPPPKNVSFLLLSFSSFNEKLKYKRNINGYHPSSGALRGRDREGMNDVTMLLIIFIYKRERERESIACLHMLHHRPFSKIQFLYVNV